MESSPSMEAVVGRLSEICKELVEVDGKLGAGKKFVKFEMDAGKVGKDQFAATAMFGNIHTTDESHGKTTANGESTFPVVIKAEPPDESTRKFFHSDFQFHNEILFYSRLLPFLNSFQTGNLRQSSYPFAKFLKGGKNDPVLRSYIIMENASHEGFRLSESRQVLDLEHLLLIMNRLGRFHAVSYIAKHVDHSYLLELCAQIRETSWTDERLVDGHENDILLSASVTRAIEKFDNACAEIDTGDSKQTDDNPADGSVQESDNTVKCREQLSKLKKLLIGNPIRFMRDITRPEEPMAVLNHGDFCRNNILFQYDDKDANESASCLSPREALFFDVATIRYSSPVIDLSFCIYLNSNAEIRRHHWDQIVESYHDGLRVTVQAYANEHGVDVTEGKRNFTSNSSIFLPSLQDIHSEFVLHALYGLVHCSFFLPMMMDSSFQELAKETAVDFWNLPTEEKVRAQNLVAGEDGTRALNDIVEHLLEMGFV